MWLSHLTGKKSGYLAEPNKPPASSGDVSQGGSNKKKKLADGMDVATDIDEGSFFWIGEERPAALPSSSSSLSSSPSSTTSTTPSSSFSFLQSGTPSLYPSFSSPTMVGGRPVPSSSTATASSALPPPYPGRPSSSASSSLHRPTNHHHQHHDAFGRMVSHHGAGPHSVGAGQHPFHTAAYAPLSQSSFIPNPKLSPLRRPPTQIAAGVWDKLQEMESKLRQGTTYDPCFEVEIIAQVKHDRQVQEEKRSTLEERHRKQVEMLETEAKRRQDVEITKWVEQQQRKQRPLDENAAGLPSTGSNGASIQLPGEGAEGLDNMDGIGDGGRRLIDLSGFPSPIPPHRVPAPAYTASSSQVLGAPQNVEPELLPPYPGGPRPTPQQNASINFPTPASASQFLPPEQVGGAFMSPLAASTAAPVVAFPAPTAGLMSVIQPSPTLTYLPHHPYQSFAVPAPFPPHSSPHLSTASPSLPASTPFTMPMMIPKAAPRDIAGSGSGNTHTTSSLVSTTATTTAPMKPAQRTTMEEYQRKYPVLSNAEKRAIFINMLEMRFKPEIVAMGLEVFPDSKVERIITFVSNFHKLADMGYAPERIKQALLRYDDIQKAIVYIEELDKLIQEGLRESQIADALVMFNNDIEKASAFLQAYQTLAQLGFDDLHIREALLMCDSNTDKAAQYLMNGGA